MKAKNLKVGQRIVTGNPITRGAIKLIVLTDDGLIRVGFNGVIDVLHFYPDQEVTVYKAKREY